MKNDQRAMRAALTQQTLVRRKTEAMEERNKLLKEIDEGLTLIYALQRELKLEIQCLKALLQRANLPAADLETLMEGEYEQPIAG